MSKPKYARNMETEGSSIIHTSSWETKTSPVVWETKFGHAGTYTERKIHFLNMRPKVYVGLNVFQ